MKSSVEFIQAILQDIKDCGMPKGFDKERIAIALTNLCNDSYIELKYNTDRGYYYKITEHGIFLLEQAKRL